MSINTITLVGRAGRDPETRFFESGSVVTNLSLAVNRPSRDEEPDWFNLEIWGKQAQVAADYVRKGSLIGVVGRMTSEQWTDRTTGERRSKPVVKVDRLALLGSRADNASSPPFDGQSTAQAAAPAGAKATSQQSAAAPPPTPAPAASSGLQGWAGSPISDEEVPF
ncbi:MAG: single-stranded DNA-binding protein [Prochlorococcaceae cyanobacterium]